MALTLNMRERAERKAHVSGAVIPLGQLRPYTIDFFGGPGRTRTCNQTVMSGRISVGFVDFATFLFDLDRVRCVSIRLFLVRNWCGMIVRSEIKRDGCGAV